MNYKTVMRATGYTTSPTFNINTDFSIDKLINRNKYILLLPIDLPAMTNILPVYVVVNLNGTQTAIPMQDIVGNNLMSDQLRFLSKNIGGTRKGVARLVYGGNPAHFKVLQCLPESSAVEYEESVVLKNAPSKTASAKSSN